MTQPFAKLAGVFLPVALAIYVWLSTAGFGPSFEARDLRGVVAFFIVALLADVVAVDFRIGAGTHQPKSSLAFLPFLGSIVLFPPAISIAVVTVVVFISQLVLRRNSIFRSAYNVAQAGISASVAAAIYHSLVSGDATSPSFPAFVLAAASFFIANIVLASVAISLIHKQSLTAVLSQITGPNGSNLWYDFLASPIAIVPVLLYESSPVLGILVIVLPLLLINYSYKSKQEVIEANKDLLRVLVKAIETRDPYTSGHSVRVANLARAIARDLKLSPRRIHQVETAALLHDIGKIDPCFTEVLRKPHALSDEERALIQTHAARGAELLGTLRSVDPEVVSSVLHHHEWYDGRGYPKGLSGAAIPLAARIIMLCDSVDAMLSDRPYRKALGLDVVHRELRDHSGTQFDPEIVEVVLQCDTINMTVAQESDLSAGATAHSQTPVPTG